MKYERTHDPNCYVSYKLIINYFLQYDFYSETPKDINKSKIMKCVCAEEEALCLDKVCSSLSTADYENLRQRFSSDVLCILSDEWEGGSIYINSKHKDLILDN